MNLDMDADLMELVKNSNDMVSERKIVHTFLHRDSECTTFVKALYCLIFKMFLRCFEQIEILLYLHSQKVAFVC